MIHHRGRALLS